MADRSKITILIFILFLAPFFLLSGQTVEKGVLDLSRHDFEKTAVVSLDGSWLFLWQKFADPRSISLDENFKEIPIPGTWTAIGHSQQGYATYAMTLLVPPRTEPYALHLGIVASAYRLYVNGRLMVQIGQASAESDLVIPAWKTLVVPLDAGQSEYRLLFHISNTHDTSGGLVAPVHFGPLQAIITERGYLVGMDSFIVGCLLIMGFYHIGLFFFRRVERYPFYFGMLCLFFALRALCYGQVLLATLIPGIPQELLMKLGYLTLSLSVAMMLRFMVSLFTEERIRKIDRALIIIALVYSAIIILFPLQVYNRLLTPFLVVTLLTALYVLFILARAIRSRKPGALIFLIGFSFIFIFTGLDIVLSVFFGAVNFFGASLGLLFFILFQSYVQIRRYSWALRQSEELTEMLSCLNRAMDRFVPKEFLSFLNKSSITEINLGDHVEKNMAVMFVDIRDFTGLSGIMSPQENFKFINSYLKRMGPIIRGNRGFVDKYVGDGIMALFASDVDDAVECAVSIVEELDKYNTERDRAGYKAIDLAIGIHSGPLMLGTIGENQRMDGTVISDVVNLASRMEGLAKKHEKRIMITGQAWEALSQPERFAINFVSYDRVKGKEDAVACFEVTGRALVSATT